MSLKICFIAPCVGLGGADIVMASLIKNMPNIECKGIFLWQKYTKTMHEHYKQNHLDTDIYCHTDIEAKNINNCDIIKTFEEIASECDYIISWCTPDLQKFVEKVTTPVIEYIHGTDERTKSLVENNKKYVKHYLACSKSCLKAVGVNGSVIYNGVDLNRLSPRKGSKHQKKIWGLTEEKKTLLFCGRFVEEKRPEDLIYTINCLPKEWIGLFVGHGPRQDQLISIAKDLTPGRIAFLDNQYHMGDVYDSIDCVLLHSDYEGLPMVMLESMYTKKPFVCSEYPVVEELEEIYGSFCHKIPYNMRPEQIAEAVLQATAMTNDNLILKSNAHNVILKNHTIATMAYCFENYLITLAYKDNCSSLEMMVRPATTREVKNVTLYDS